jgi:hypothetical protein
MGKILYGFVCLATFISFQGCCWHSSRTTERIIEPSTQSTTTVTSPQPSTTVTTTTNP